MRPWTIYIVQHSHTDIGYTQPQTEILAGHLRYIDNALDYCDRTDGYPDEAKFRWTCETAWPVREYLKVRPPEQIARLKKRVLEGRIEVTGMLLNWAEVADENALVHSLDIIPALRDSGFPVRTALQNDVNGVAWCLVDYFSDLGVDYLSVGINATRSLRPFKVPTPFWWESPSGKRVLAYRADHYSTGNFLGIHTGDIDLFGRKLEAYLQELDSAGYPFNALPVQHSGYFTDNSPPSTVSCEIVRRWNEAHEWPRLRTATVREYLEWVAKEHGSRLPVFRAAWPDWWTDGFGSAQRETAAARRVQTELIVNQGLLSMTRLLGAKLPRPVLDQVGTTVDLLHFYNEHTFGAEQSISDPLAEATQVQWGQKSSFVWQAALQSRLLGEAAEGLIQSVLSRTTAPGVAVFNTLGWPRSGLAIVSVDHQIVPRDRDVRMVDDNGKEIPLQFVDRKAGHDSWALWAEDVPALGYRTYRILAGSAPRTESAPFVPTNDTLENAFYRLVLDRKNAAIQSLYDRECARELLDPQRSWQLGQLIYERLSDRRSMEELRRGEFTRSSPENVTLKPGLDGSIWNSVTLTGGCEGFVGGEGVTCEIRLFKTAKRIDLVFRARKVGVNDPEAVYVGFPFYVPGGSLVFEAQGGIVRPGQDQLPGTASDWNTVQNFAAVRSPDAQIVLVSDEIPLMQFGGINTGRYQYETKPASQQVFSWVLNNYWTTNFRSSQEGGMTWSYSLTSGRDAGNGTATRFGWGARVPLVARVLSGTGETAGGGGSRSLWPFKPSAILLVSCRPAGEGVILHLREVEGKPVVLEPAAPGMGQRLEEVNANGAPLRPVTAVSFGAFESKFVRIGR